MPIYYGSNEITNIYDGGTEIGEVYYGGDLVFSSYQEIFLGNVDINATGDYKYNYYCDAKAYKIRDHGRYYLKITGKWYSMGESVSGNVQAFSTNINAGAQTSQVNFTCNCFYNTQSDTGTRYNTYDAYVTTGGVVYLPIGHENCYRTFNQYNYDQTLIPLTA